MLLSSAKFSAKAEEVLKEELEQKPIHAKVEKIAEGKTEGENPKLEDVAQEDDKGGMMLYTSGTTNRPVRKR